MEQVRFKSGMEERGSVPILHVRIFAIADLNRTESKRLNRLQNLSQLITLDEPTYLQSSRLVANPSTQFGSLLISYNSILSVNTGQACPNCPNNNINSLNVLY